MYLGNCYRMYPMTVEDEVQAALAAPEHFIRGPITILTPSESRGRASFDLAELGGGGDGEATAASEPQEARPHELPPDQCGVGGSRLGK